MNVATLLKLSGAIVVVEFAGIIGSLFTIPAISNWYTALEKPFLNPPNWVFGPVWTLLYLLMGISLFLIWQKGLSRKEVKQALLIFAIQLVLNTLWSVIFFGLKNPLFAFIEIVILWAAIGWTIVAFAKISRAAAALLLPYMLWVSFAAYLNYAIWSLNA